MFRKSICLVSFVLAVGPATSAAGGDIISALLAYYPLDGNAADASGNAHDGTLMGDPQFVPGKFGQSLEFADRDCVRIEGYIPVSGAGDRAVTAWVKTSSTGVNGIVSWGVAQSGRKWVIRQQNEFLGLEIEGAAIRGRAPLTDGQWHHITVSFANDGTPELGDVEFYVDGVLDSHQASTAQIDTSITGNLEIGRNLKNDGFFQGSIDEVKIYDRALSAEEVLEDMQGPPRHTKATLPDPPDRATDVPRKVTLRWTPLESADKHDIYFGADFNGVNDATAMDPMGPDRVYRGRQPGSSYVVPETLAFGQTYFWRIDEVNAPPASAVVSKGDIWRFTVEPLAYPVKNIIAAASSNDVDRGPQNTVDGSGLDSSGLLHVKNSEGTMWLSSISGPQPTWIEYQFDRLYKLHQLWIWNYNDFMEPVLGLGCKDVAIEYSTNGSDCTMLGTTHEFARAPGADDYAHNTTVDLDGVPTRHVRFTANSNWGGLLNQYGLSEVRFLYIPVLGREPSPADGATNVDLAPILSWRTGREASSHDLYIGVDPNALALAASVAETGFDTASLDLALGQTYYWRVDEVNDAETPAAWQGDLWNFSTREYLVVDDFESYNDIEAGQEGSHLIYLTWADGFDDPAANGSTVGYTEPFQPTMETAVVHGGKQSVPLRYNNSVASLSEIAVNTSDLPIGGDWTQGAPTALTLWFYGDPNNAATEQMYVKIDGVKVVYPGDAADITVPAWKRWDTDLAASGLSLNHVTQLGIGFERTGPSGGTGIVFIDDIWLYRARTAP